MRLACVFVPQIALQAVLRRFPDLRGRPVALTKTPAGVRQSGRAKVVLVSAEARRAGVRPGLTAAQAAAACAPLTCLPLAGADVAAAEAALADLGFAFAPRIDREPARIFFEIGDLGQLYPSESAIAQTIQARARHLGLGVRVAVAAQKATARVATRAGERLIVPTGGDAPFLAPLPLQVLGEPLPPALVETFARWGIDSAGALARLPAAEVGLRLGAEGARLHRLASGLDDEPFLPALPADAVEEGVDLDHAIAELEPLSFVLRGLFDRLLARLACRGLACAGITLRLQLETRAFAVHEINLAAPTREAAPLVQLARLDLTRRPPDAAVDAVLVVARPARVRTAQMDFLRPTGPAPDRLAATIARLAALCGPDNVGVPRVEDTWREEAAGMGTFTLDDGGGPGVPPGPLEKERAPAGQRMLTIRRYRPPEEIEVMWGPDGPAALRGPDTTARILIAAGPYRLSGEWWRPDEGESPRDRRFIRGDNDSDSDNDNANRHANTNGSQDSDGDGNGFSRDYWDVHASDGALYRLHHDRHHDRWFLDGYYD